MKKLIARQYCTGKISGILASQPFCVEACLVHGCPDRPTSLTGIMMQPLGELKCQQKTVFTTEQSRYSHSRQAFDWNTNNHTLSFEVHAQKNLEQNKIKVLVLDPERIHQKN